MMKADGEKFTIKATPLKMFREKAYCDDDDCGKASELKVFRQRLKSDLPQYRHYCPECGKNYLLPCVYPSDCYREE